MVTEILNKMAEIVAATMTSFQSDFEKYDAGYISREGVKAFPFLWKIATHDANANSYLVKFYAELGVENRLLLLEWVMANYNDEQKIGESNNERSEAQILAKIREWAEDIPYWLSNREGYPRGYREGMIRAHRIAMSIITGEPLND